MTFKFPKPGQHVYIWGRTGSGKTRFGSWLFSNAQFRRMPHLIFDFKGDDLLTAIDRKRVIGLNETPKHPGLYYVRPRPDQLEEVEALLWRIWERGKTGLFLDEGYMIPKSSALNAILTQGRSKQIGVQTLTQRPAWCSRFIRSEAGFYCGFRLNDRNDEKTVREFTPENPVWDFERELPKYHSRWYDAINDYSCVMTPVPGDAEILDRYDRALAVKMKGL